MTLVTVNSRGDPETKTIRVKRLIGSNKEQLIIRSHIFLPYQRPAINKVIYIKNLLHNHYAEIISERVLIKGSLTFEIAYISENQNQPNRFVANTTYYDFIDVPEATAEMIADINSKIESVTFIDFDKNNRIVTVEILINNHAIVYGFEEINFITGLPSGHEGKFEKITINEIAGVVKGNLQGDEEIFISSSKPAIKKIIKYNCMPMLQNYDINLGSVTAYGWLKLIIVYLDYNDQQQYLERFIPFSKILAAPNAQTSLLSEVFVTAHNAECTLQSDKSFLFKHSTYFKACVFATKTLSVLVESNSLDTEKRSFVCESLADIQSVETIVKESSEINQDLVDTEVKDLKVGPVNFLVKQLINKKVLIRGYVDLLVGYVDSKSASLKYLYSKGFFKTVVEVSNATVESKVELIPVVNFTKAYFSKDKLTINCLLNIIVKVLNLKQIVVVTEFSSPDSEGADDEVSFSYIMQPGDEPKTLASRFGTTVEAIYKLNPQLTQPFENKKINIPCQIKKI